jgi:hypothetical protein
MSIDRRDAYAALDTGDTHHDVGMPAPGPVPDGTDGYAVGRYSVPLDHEVGELYGEPPLARQVAAEGADEPPQEPDTPPAFADDETLMRMLHDAAADVFKSHTGAHLYAPACAEPSMTGLSCRREHNHPGPHCAWFMGAGSVELW